MNPQGQYLNLDVGAPKKLKCGDYCGCKFIACYVFWALVAIAVGFSAGAYMYFKLSADDQCLVPKSGCGDLSPATGGYYNIKKDLNVGSSFWYTANFEETITPAEFNQTTIHLGKMHLCVQTTGAQKVDPTNCTLSYIYEKSKCILDFKNSDCDIDVSHTKTDNRLYQTRFDSKLNQVYLDFFSHSGITGGTYVLEHSDKPMFDCAPATNAAPIEICPKTSLFEHLAKSNI